MKTTIALSIAVTLLLLGNADAKRHHHKRHIGAPQTTYGYAYDASSEARWRGRAQAPHYQYASLQEGGYSAMPEAQPTHGRASHRVARADNGSVLHGRPSGCPHRYCGCEASLYLFGRIRPDLNLASNWYRKFAAASPAPGMAAARNGHVMVLVNHVGGSNWLVHDGNSGRGLTREHVRSISGYRIVNPHGSRVASR
jgi:hypothetical protein